MLSYSHTTRERRLCVRASIIIVFLIRLLLIALPYGTTQGSHAQAELLVVPTNKHHQLLVHTLRYMLKLTLHPLPPYILSPPKSTQVLYINKREKMDVRFIVPTLGTKVTTPMKLLIALKDLLFHAPLSARNMRTYTAAAALQAR